MSRVAAQRVTRIPLRRRGSAKSPASASPRVRMSALATTTRPAPARHPAADHSRNAPLPAPTTPTTVPGPGGAAPAAPAAGRLRALAPALAVILGVATLLRVGFDQYLNYDARY